MLDPSFKGSAEFDSRSRKELAKVPRGKANAANILSFMLRKDDRSAIKLLARLRQLRLKVIMARLWPHSDAAEGRSAVRSEPFQVQHSTAPRTKPSQHGGLADACPAAQYDEP